MVEKVITLCFFFCSGLYDELGETSKELIDLVKLAQVNNSPINKEVRLFYCT
jgi:hypothetical protein